MHCCRVSLEGPEPQSIDAHLCLLGHNGDQFVIDGIEGVAG